MVELFASNGDPNKTPRSAASDIGLHCLPVTRLGSPVFNGLEQTPFQEANKTILRIASPESVSITLKVFNFIS